MSAEHPSVIPLLERGDASSRRPVRALARTQVPADGCDVVLSPDDYREFEAQLTAPPRVIPELAAMLRRHR
jgi:hypothetical protein